MPRKILAPHHEQDGYAYYRLPNSNLSRRVFIRAMEIIGLGRGMDEPWYPDDAPNQRIISSRRVEEAVETADFLKLCAEEGLAVTKFPLIRKADMRWRVEKYTDTSTAGCGATLREAYYRYKAEAELDAQQPIESETDDNARYCSNCYFEDTPDGHSPCHECIADGNAVDWSRPLWVKKHD